MCFNRYFWKDGNSSVTLNKDIETPNFRVLGHKLSEKLVTLATGELAPNRLSCRNSYDTWLTGYC